MSGWRRAAVVFLAAFVLLGIFAGKRLLTASKDNHFTHLAQGWLEGRWTLEDKPPGWCVKKKRGRCQHQFDDYAVLYELTPKEGPVVRGYPCVTPECKTLKREQRTARWWVVGQGWTDYGPRQVKIGKGTWFITFPPGPAVLMLPFVALFGLGLWDVLLTVLAGAAIPAVLVAFLDRERGTADGRGTAHLLAAGALVAASPLLWLAPHGRVWFTAQVFAALLLTGYLSAVWNLRRPILAAVLLGLAVACRPTVLPAGLVFAVMWWKSGRRIGPALRFVLPLAAIGLALALHNALRFEDPFEFGHRYLQIRWQARMQSVGMFSTDYLERNLRCLASLLPVRDGVAPGFKVSIHGSALWVGSPWLVAAVFARRGFVGRGALWLSALLCAIPPLLYQNSGQLQYSYRFAVDWLPLVVAAMALGGAFDPRPGGSWRNPRAWWLPALVLAGALFQGWGAWNFERARGKLFVAQPMGWPFESELEGV